MGKKRTLCESCDIEVFISCPFVHGRGRIDNMKTLPVLIKYYDHYVSGEMVIKCPAYIKEKKREIG